MSRTVLVRRPLPPDGCRFDHLSLVLAHSRRWTSLLPTHLLPALTETTFPDLASPKLPPPAQKLPPSNAPLSRAQMYLPAYLPIPAHAVPIPAPSRRPLDSPLRTCSGRFSWLAANNARVAAPPSP